MISLDENALICDLAETYQIYDYKQLPPLTVAVFSYGLRSDSRIKMKMSDQSVPLETLLLANLNDKINLLVWFKTKDAQKNHNRPVSILDSIQNKPSKERDVSAFSSGEEFENRRNELIRRVGKVGEK